MHGMVGDFIIIRLTYAKSAMSGTNCANFRNVPYGGSVSGSHLLPKLISTITSLDHIVSIIGL